MTSMRVCIGLRDIGKATCDTLVEIKASKRCAVIGLIEECLEPSGTVVVEDMKSAVGY